MYVKEDVIRRYENDIGKLVVDICAGMKSGRNRHDDGVASLVFSRCTDLRTPIQDGGSIIII